MFPPLKWNFNFKIQPVDVQKTCKVAFCSSDSSSGFPGFTSIITCCEQDGVYCTERQHQHVRKLTDWSIKSFLPLWRNKLSSTEGLLMLPSSVFNRHCQCTLAVPVTLRKGRERRDNSLVLPPGQNNIQMFKISDDSYSPNLSWKNVGVSFLNCCYFTDDDCHAAAVQNKATESSIGIFKLLKTILAK